MENPANEPARKRLRTSHACDVCRARKIRCDGNTPCSACFQAENECTYGSEANSRGKTDLILDGVLRLERVLQEMNSTLAQSPYPERRFQSIISPLFSSSAGRSSFSGGSLPDVHVDRVALRHPQTPQSDTHNDNNLENAVLDSLHTSTTESVLSWPHFDVFPSLRRDYVSIFRLEQSRPPMRSRASTMYPYVSSEDIDDILDSFEHAVNFWYPTMSRNQLERIRQIVINGAFDEEGPYPCLALLTMALGCASQVISCLADRDVDMTDDEVKRRAAKRAMGDMFFDGALKKLYVAHTNVSSIATHCLFFSAVYFAFLRRPLQAWDYIHAAAGKCLLLLSYPPHDETSEDQERVRRIFWSCYILESDYLAELSSLPLSGIARIESSVPLPGDYNTHTIPLEEEQSSLYFLACISMRRLLNRVHQLLYARGTGASLDNAKFPYVVAELNHQLDEWRDVLPTAFAFTVGYDCQPTATEHGAFLRQRYLTCQSVIYRPYLMWMLSGLRSGSDGTSPGSDPPTNQEALKNCKACLDACLLHVLNLKGFAQTVLVDTWICSLSMAGAMLVLLAACRVPVLRSQIEVQVLSAGEHLRSLLESWQKVSGDPSSPSVNQSVRIISEADRFIQEVYGSKALD